MGDVPDFQVVRYGRGKAGVLFEDYASGQGTHTAGYVLIGESTLGVAVLADLRGVSQGNAGTGCTPFIEYSSVISFTAPKRNSEFFDLVVYTTGYTTGVVKATTDNTEVVKGKTQRTWRRIAFNRTAQRYKGFEAGPGGGWPDVSSGKWREQAQCVQ